MSLSLIPSLLIPLGSIVSLILVLVALSGPFVCWGTTMGVLFRAYGENAGHLFGACVTGSALGLLLSLGLLDVLNGPLPTIMLSAAVLGVTGFSVYRIKRNAVLVAAAVLVLVTLGIAVRWNPAPVAQWSSGVTFRGTTLSQTAKQPGNVIVLDTIWNAQGRTDSIGLGSGKGDFRWIVNEGSMSGIMPGNPGTKDMQWLKNGFPLVALPFLARRPDSALVVAPGGGLAIRMASDAGSTRIRGIEPINAMKAILDRSQAYHGDLPGRNGVELLFDDVRKNLRNDTAFYDAVYLSIREPAGLPWIGAGLGESGLTTQEAFEEYWRHLSPGGILMMNFCMAERGHCSARRQDGPDRGDKDTL